MQQIRMVNFGAFFIRQEPTTVQYGTNAHHSEIMLTIAEFLKLGMAHNQTLSSAGSSEQ